MSRYYFHLRRTDGLEEDREGADLPNQGAVREAALERARDILKSNTRENADPSKWAFEIVDESGGEVLVMPFMEAAEPKG